MEANLPWTSFQTYGNISSSYVFLVFRYLGCYELVQDKRRKFPPPRMPLAPSIRVLHTSYLESYRPRWTVVYEVLIVGDMATFGLGPKIGASSVENKRVPTHHRPSKRPTLVTRFRRKTFSLCFWIRRLQVGTPWHVCKRFHANIRRSDLPTNVE